MVNSDIRSLQNASDFQREFVGGIDLATYARERQVVPDARCSLADLCANVLHKRLDKNVSARISNQWSNSNLTIEQINYAARDAYASLEIFNALQVLPLPRPLPPNPEAGLLVQIYHDDSTRIIAYGETVEFPSSSFNGIAINKHRIVVEVTQVLVPAAIIRPHGKQPLCTFGPPPFKIVTLRSRLKIVPPSSKPQSPVLSHTNQSSSETSEPLSGSLPQPDLMANSNPPPDAITVADLIHPDCAKDQDQDQPTPGRDKTEYEVDESSRDEGKQILGPTPMEWPSNIRSRVLKDPFHIFKMFYISRSHGLRYDFANALRDAMFIPNLEDKQRIEAWGATLSPPLSFEDIRKQSPKTLWRHCRRTIPPPEYLYSLIKDVFHTYGPLRDAQTGKTLFDANSWKTSKNVLELVWLGQLSDPPDISLYTQIGYSPKFGGLPVYRCSRGTNFTEGGVHTHLRPRLPTSGASIRHVNASLMDFALRHNLLVSELLMISLL